VILLDVVAGGLVLGGMYALVAIGFNLQYGIARVLNLAYGEFLVTAAFAAYWMLTLWRIDPIAGMAISVPVTFAANWLVYRIFIEPLARRSANRDQFEGDTILSTFGLLFVINGSVILAFTGDLRSYDYLSGPVNILGLTFAMNRLVALAVACICTVAIFSILTWTRTGMAMRALAVDPLAASIMAIDVPKISALAFATGGALVAVAGTLVSTFLSFDPTVGVDFTVKAIIVVIMGGVGNMLGCLAAGLLLGLTESFTARFLDSGLKLAVAYVMFLLVLLFRPRGMFGSN
jgi:branched-chain amino acid transport system permease protein